MKGVSVMRSRFKYKFLNTTSPILPRSELTQLSRVLSDDEILRYISERKRFDTSKLRNFNPKPIKGHKKKIFEIDGVDGTKFKLFYRENIKNPLDFSVGLLLVREDTGEDFVLRRYNGKSHRHKNKCPLGKEFVDFHIHNATKECQEKCDHEEDFAVITNEYSTARQALDCMLRDCGFNTMQSTLFGGF